MGFEAFALAVHRLLNFDTLFDALFHSTVKHINRRVSLDHFSTFLNNEQQVCKKFCVSTRKL